MANIRYNGMQPINRYSLNQRVLPGQYKRLGGTNLFTSRTYIQNNFYGGGFGNYDYGCYGQCNGGGNNKFMNWMMGIGMFSTVLGGIFKLFSGGDENVEGKGGDTPKKAAEPKTELKVETPKVETPVTTVNKPEVEIPEVQVPETITAPTVTVPETSPFDVFKNGLEMVCRDDSGKTQNISGKLSNVTGEAGKAPTSFVITDTSSGKPNAYKYEDTGKTDDKGNPIYKCVSKNGVEISGSSEYTFVNGKLVQYSNQSNFGSGMKFGTQASTVGSANRKPTQGKQPTYVQTSSAYGGGMLPLSDATIKTKLDELIKAGNSEDIDGYLATLSNKKDAGGNSDYDTAIAYIKHANPKLATLDNLLANCSIERKDKNNKYKNLAKKVYDSNLSHSDKIKFLKQIETYAKKTLGTGFDMVENDIVANIQKANKTNLE